MTSTAAGPATARFGPYRLHGLIGRGAQGEVHRAVDSAHDGRVVALKLLPPAVSGDPERRERFRQEAETVARLGEPHVIPVHGYGEIDGRLYLDMLLVDGPDLGAFLQATGPLPAGLAVAVVEQVAAALDAAHGAGLVHHDVKPSNVLVHRPVPGRTPHVLLADFGVVGDVDGLGTVEYLAPERISGLPGDHRVDVYALACVLFELLTGARAFAGGELAAQVHGHLHLPPPRPSQLLAALPPQLDAVIARGMAKQPEHRQSSAGELAAEARAALGAARGRPTRRQVLLGALAGAVAFGGGLAATTAVRGSGPTTAAAGPAVAVASAGPPAPVVVERALGIRTTERNPFVLAPVGGGAVAVVPTADGFQGWDLVLDRAVGPALSGDVVNGVATDARQTALVEVDGVPVLCTVAFDEPAVVLRDLRTGQPIGRPLVPTGAPVAAIAVVRVDGRPVLVALDGNGALARQDMRTGVPLGEPVTRAGANTLSEIGVVALGGRDCVVTNDSPAIFDWTVQDAATGAEVGRWSGLEDMVAELDGRPVVLGVAGRITAVDLGTGAELRVVPADDIRVGAVVRVDGRLLVAAGGSGEIALYDVAAGTRVGTPMRGHEAELSWLGAVSVGDRPLLVSTALDNSVRVWDVAVHAHGG
jgi:hypothetical protein